MTPPADVVFLFDVDNTLLDNDRVQDDLGHYLADRFGARIRERYWALFEELRDELGHVDYFGAVQRCWIEERFDQRLLAVPAFLLEYPFADRVYPRALDVLRHVGAFGPAAILTDGEAVFQPAKVQRSGLWRAVEGRVLIYIHKERMLDDIARHYPARHYVVVDDKRHILAAIKKGWGDRVTTVWPLQGHYALDPRAADQPPADLTIGSIADLLGYDAPALCAAGRSPAGSSP